MYAGAFSHIHSRREIGLLEAPSGGALEKSDFSSSVDVGKGSHVDAGPLRGPGESLEKDAGSKSLIVKLRRFEKVSRKFEEVGESSRKFEKV